MTVKATPAQQQPDESTVATGYGNFCSPSGPQTGITDTTLRLESILLDQLKEAEASARLMSGKLVYFSKKEPWLDLIPTQKVRCDGLTGYVCSKTNQPVELKQRLS